MSGKKIKQALKDFGLSPKEVETYISLARQGPLTGGEISKATKTHRPTIYRILKNLLRKGVVDTTFESPIRFMALPFETILESNIQAKKEEISSIEKIRKDLLDDWKNLRKTGIEFSIEKFVVIEGKRRILQRISQTIIKTQNQLCAILDVIDLLIMDQFGILDTLLNQAKKQRIQFRLITQLTKQNIDEMKALLRRNPKYGINLKARFPNIGPNTPLRMISRDNKEIFIFTNPRTESASPMDEGICLWTNSKTLVQTFNSIFEDSWLNSVNFETKKTEIETGKPTLRTHFVSDLETAYKNCNDILSSAKNEIIILTSSNDLITYSKRSALLKRLRNNGVNIKIMAPITRENLGIALEMSKFCDIRHGPQNYLKTIFVDGKHLFQFRIREDNQNKLQIRKRQNAIYSDDIEYIGATKTSLINLWKNSIRPSPITIESIIGKHITPTTIPFASTYDFHKFYSVDRFKNQKITEEDVLKKISEFKKNLIKKRTKEMYMMSCSAGHALIHSPNLFNLPNSLISVYHIDEESLFGAEDALIVNLIQKTPKGYKYVTVASVGDNPKASEAWKKTHKGTPAEKNYHLLKRDELQIQTHGETLFAGWTIPIPLIPEKYCLPPSAILFEAYGKVKPRASSIISPTGVKQNIYTNNFDAFVTVMHQKIKYQAPSTNGLFVREEYHETYPKG